MSKWKSTFVIINEIQFVLNRMLMEKQHQNTKRVRQNDWNILCLHFIFIFLFFTIP